jgi:hypothetical protein
MSLRETRQNRQKKLMHVDERCDKKFWAETIRGIAELGV